MALSREEYWAELKKRQRKQYLKDIRKGGK